MAAAAMDAALASPRSAVESLLEEKLEAALAEVEALRSETAQLKLEQQALAKESVQLREETETLRGELKELRLRLATPRRPARPRRGRPWLGQRVQPQRLQLPRKMGDLEQMGRQPWSGCRCHFGKPGTWRPWSGSWSSRRMKPRRSPTRSSWRRRRPWRQKPAKRRRTSGRIETRQPRLPRLRPPGVGGGSL